jgi:IS5 family transposase
VAWTAENVLRLMKEEANNEDAKLQVEEKRNRKKKRKSRWRKKKKCENGKKKKGGKKANSQSPTSYKLGNQSGFVF